MEKAHTATDPTDPTLPRLTFLYHELRPSKSEYSYALETKEFEQQAALFARIQSDLRQTPGSGLWPDISFDDGHQSNYEHALPILAAHGLVAHFFITAGWTGHKPGYMDWPALRSLHQAGQRIGAHGWTHALLTHCTASQLEKELAGARTALEDNLGAAITTMSLPGGRCNHRVLAACRAAGYTRIFTSVPRAQSVPQDALTGRLNIRAGMDLAWIEQLLQPAGKALLHLERRHRLKQAAQALLGDRLYTRAWAMINKQESQA